VEQGFAFGMIVQHEQQHDETMLSTHQLRTGPPVLHAPPPPAAAAPPAVDEVLVPAGPFTMGTDTEPWALDNERPAHVVHLPAFRIDAAPVTTGAYSAFVDAGGYDDPRWWSERGWAHRLEAGLVAPQFWERDGDTWWRRRFGVLEPVLAAEPVCHVCFFEAEAYATWAGKRLPTEAEWEKAARFDPATGRSRRFPWGDDEPTPALANLGQRHLQPAPVGAYPAGVSPLGVHQMVGDVWEWTTSGWHPYPGFSVFPYPEYSQVFFGGDYRVLRGGSFGTDAAAIRSTFRNWDHPIRRQIFSGFRCARSVEPGSGPEGA
jgi:iron(II)-dependent oxidoreductase